MQIRIDSKEELFQADMQRDAAICGFGLQDPGKTELKGVGAHDPTPTPYFILEELFSQVEFSESSHLLDVGCGMGRVLAFFKGAGLPGRATGVELDTHLAQVAQGWTSRYDSLDVVAGNALDLDLSSFTHYYLFNPFDTNVLLQFLAALEAQAAQPVSLIHMSDNGETYFYMGREGWSLVCQGEYLKYRNDKGRSFSVYNHPQHYSIWRYEPSR